mmetsp:Transcript_25881/g.67868  ORF Transcript_25881/g.67868 Transcript_25881/m.67868 type:complete len:130 (+) Transcript_25881:348-737(+)
MSTQETIGSEFTFSGVSCILLSPVVNFLRCLQNLDVSEPQSDLVTDASWSWSALQATVGCLKNSLDDGYYSAGVSKRDVVTEWNDIVIRYNQERSRVGPSARQLRETQPPQLSTLQTKVPFFTRVQMPE